LRGVLEIRAQSPRLNLLQRVSGSNDLRRWIPEDLTVLEGESKLSAEKNVRRMYVTRVSAILDAI
jgi:hypothetical protein